MRPFPSCLASVAVLFIAFLLPGCGSDATTTGCSNDATVSMRAPTASAPQLGPSDAWVTIVEYSDFQCPYCAQVQPTLAALRSQYGNDVRIVFRNFPLSFHAMAAPAAVAAQCAGNQGHYWEFHDWLFANQSTALASASAFEAAAAAQATALGLDVGAWQACRADPATLAAVNADAASGASIGVRGTPTFAINGIPLVGAQPLSAFQCTVDAALARSRASGVSASAYYGSAVLGQ
jgi:protein-disulfide isomerase